MTVDMSAFSTEYSFDRNRSGRAGAAYGPAQLAEVDAPAVDRCSFRGQSNIAAAAILATHFCGLVADLRMQRIGRSIRRRRGRFA